VDELLAENELLLQAVDEATVTGRLDEAAGYVVAALFTLPTCNNNSAVRTEACE
jgi:hypothetical protein